MVPAWFPGTAKPAWNKALRPIQVSVPSLSLPLLSAVLDHVWERHAGNYGANRPQSEQRRGFGCSGEPAGTTGTKGNRANRQSVAFRALQCADAQARPPPAAKVNTRPALKGPPVAPHATPFGTAIARPGIEHGRVVEETPT